MIARMCTTDKLVDHNAGCYPNKRPQTRKPTHAGKEDHHKPQTDKTGSNLVEQVSTLVISNLARVAGAFGPVTFQPRGLRSAHIYLPSIASSTRGLRLIARHAWGKSTATGASFNDTKT